MEVAAFAVGGLQVYAYGLLLLGAILLGGAGSFGLARLHGEGFDSFVNLFLLGGVFSAVSSRLVYVGTHWEEFYMQPLSFLCLWQGGYSFLGGFLGLCVAVFIYGRIQGLDGWLWLDVFMPQVLLIAFVFELFHFLLCGMGKVAPSWYAAGMQFVLFLLVTFASFWQERRRRRWRSGVFASVGMAMTGILQLAGSSSSLMGGTAAFFLLVFSLVFLVYRGSVHCDYF